MIQRIKHVHKRGFIHRDIKPENFLMGLGAKANTLYLIDFGLARRYRFRTEGRSLKHIPFSKSKSFIGTAKYASLNSLRSAELSRRDDLESIAYVLIEMINGELPWKNILRPRGNTPKSSMHRQMLRAKEQTDWTKVCPGMADFVKYCRELPFEAEPDYDLLIECLRRATVPIFAPAMHRTPGSDILDVS
ncbi:casein kinase 1 epsilon [Aphelenchoides avenae]|nr:casein kinase 1 epsilon [Aphelenchus avenae]